MTGRERELAAIRHRVPDRIPVDVIDIENRPAVAAHLGVGETEIATRLGLDGVLLGAYRYQDELPRGPDGRPLLVWGVEDGTDYGTAHFYPLAHAETVAEIEQYAHWPNADRFDFDALAATVRALDGSRALRGPYWISAPLFCTACNLMGMEEAMMKMLSAPAAFEACVEKVWEFSQRYVENFLAACGERLDILCLADDFATQRGLMFDPALWRKFLKPRYERLLELGRQRGLPIWFHSCGDVTAVLPDLIDLGVDVWETVQLHALPMTPIELKRQFGRHLTFFGGINTQRLPFVQPAQVRVEVRRVIEQLGEGGGYICGPDHHLKPDVPPANVVALFDAGTAFRQPGWTAGTNPRRASSFDGPAGRTPS